MAARYPTVFPAELDPAAEADLATHAGRTTTVHGIADTSLLVVEDDPRLADERDPPDGSVGDAKIAPEGLSAGSVNGTAIIESDPRLGDPREPLTHAATHASAGTDPVTPAAIGAETPAGAQTKATAAQTAAAGALATHEADTTAVHGIADTSALVLSGDARLADQRVPTDGSVTTAKVAVGGIAESAVTNLVTDLAARVPLAVLATAPDQLVVGAVTRGNNGEATAAPVAWPDGATGAFTATTLSPSFRGAIDAYTITHVVGAVTVTYTQPAVTRDVRGAVTNRPAIVVS